METEQETPNKVIGKDFVIELAKYFMLFLETDFKKRRQPKRNLSSRMNKGLSVGLYLDKYPSLQKDLYKNFISGFIKEEFSIEQKQYTTKIPASLTELVEHRIDKLSDTDLEKLIENITEDIDKARLDNQKQYDNYLEEAVEQIKQSIASKIIVPLISDIEKPLQVAGLSTEAGLFQLEVDSREKLFNILESSLDGVLKKYFADNEKPEALKVYFRDQFSRDTVTKLLKDFFHDFSTADAYSEVYQLHRNKEMLDKTELYIYFCELSINTFSFPLFYSPVNTIQSGTEVRLEMDSRIFLNTKAIEYVLQEFNLQTGNKESMGNKLDRILYIDNKKELLAKLQDVINKLASLLDVDTVDLKETTNQSKSNLVVKVNNRLQLFLFDKSDEALINDYEEIINDEGDLADSFSELINGFISENPDKFIEDIADEWGEKEISEKLVIQSPIPLNEEQKQVMLALQKDDCNIVILEGPPGTGKSHTITAIVCKALLDGQSVLVLSDKDEALDVVQDKITEALNTIRHDKNFQNPILRLGKTGGGLAKVIDGQSLERVREHYRAYKAKKSDFEGLTEERTSAAISEVDRVKAIAEEIKLDEIIALEKASSKFEPYQWVDPKQASDLREPLLTLHQAVCHINDSDSNYLLSYADNSDLENIQEYLSKLEAHNTSKANAGYISTEFSTEYKKLDEDKKKVVQKKLVSLNENSASALEFCNKSSYELLKGAKLSESFESFAERRKNFYVLEDIANSSEAYLKSVDSRAMHLFKQLISYEASLIEVITAFQDYIDTIKGLKSKLFGFAGKSNGVEQAGRNLKKKLPYFDISSPEKHLGEIQILVDYLEFLEQKMQQFGVSENYWTDVIQLLTTTKDDIQSLKSVLSLLAISEDEASLTGHSPDDVQHLINHINFLRTSKELVSIAIESTTINGIIELSSIENIFLDPETYKLRLNKLNDDYKEMKSLIDSRNIIIDFYANYNYEVATKLGVDPRTFDVSLIDQAFKDMSSDELNEYLDFLSTTNRYQRLFEEYSTDEYADLTKELEVLTTAKMAHLLDSRIIEYVDKNAADIRALKNLLRAKQKFPKSLFGGLKQAFPCILAGIRDYATYIPLEKDLFDLVIIDEASQVSIAQSLPALIRGKKVLVLGDDKQFSNVKAGNASKLTNDQLKNQVLSTLRDSVSGFDRDTASLYMSKARDNFDIKNSVLEFCRFISNYEIMLKKHFRCYPEIIAYSNENFYGGELQCMKARALPVGEVLKFDYVAQDGLKDQYFNTNGLELDFIVEQLHKLKEREYEGTLGIITPHREQASLIHTTLTTSELAGWLEEHKLKVMTFDTCQGEERDYIFYSMVATKENDKHRYVFPQTLQSESGDEETNVRKQRLNVGFSRAKETVHFVLSKPIDEYWGEVRKALSFYENKLKEASSIIVGGTDPNSKMEDKIQHYFYETEFYKKNNEGVELIPQFPLGDYLRSLDKTYQHPSYKVDFLMVFGKQKIVIEYDGFKEHFVDAEGVTKDNFMSYLKEDDVYRQKVLEGYGYKFVRLNKFNLGNDPINNMNDLLVNVVKKKDLNSGAINDYLEVIESLRTGKTRSCPHCGEVKDSKFFPFPRRPECYICYEKVTGTVQRAFRHKLVTGTDLPKGSRVPKSSSKKQRYVCTNCWYESAKQFAVCPNCSGTTTYVQEASTPTKPVKTAPKKKPAPKSTSVNSVDAIELENYLRRQLASRLPANIRYQSQRKNSANKWRSLSIISYDSTYITVQGYDNIPCKYRRDRVVEIR